MSTVQFRKVDIFPDDEGVAAHRDIVVDPLFKPTLWGLYFFVFADVWINSYTDPNTSEDVTLQMVAFCFQLLTFLATAIIFYMLLSETFLIKKALYRRAMQLFKPFFYLAPSYFLLLVLRRLYQLALMYSSYPYLAVWEQPGYYVLYVAQKLGAMAYWATVMRSTNYLIREPRLYTSECVNMM